MEWLIYNPCSFEIIGFGPSASAAREHAIRNSNCMPQDFGLESWDAVDFDGDDYPNPDNWVTATQERFLEDHEQHVAATLV